MFVPLAFNVGTIVGDWLRVAVGAIVGSLLGYSHAVTDGGTVGFAG